MSLLPKVRYAAVTDVGVKRSHNQDACTTQPAANDAHWQTQGHIFVVADGMGGHAVGEKASAKAVRDIPLTYQKAVPHEGVRNAIRKAFVEANAGIYEIGQKNPEFKGMGTTATALFLRREGAWVGHVGDSRAYRIRNGKVEQLTFDHSWVWEIARRQGIDPDELGDFKKNVIIRSLGPDAEVEVDIEGPHPVLPGDAFLLCSDGLSNQIPGDEIGAIVSAFPPDEASKLLVDLANVRGGPDNITCVIVQIPGGLEINTATPQATSGNSGLKRLITKWGKRVPWSYTLLVAGSLAAVGSLALQVKEVPVFPIVLFGLAAVLIAAGIVGLILHLKATPGASSGMDESADDEVELNIYKGYPFEIGETLYDRFQQLNDSLKVAINEVENTVDWQAHQRMIDEATLRAGKKEYVSAFRAMSQAVQLLATAYNSTRNKEEEFKPNWPDPPAASA